MNEIPHLCCHSDYSFLQGVDSAERLVQAAARQGATHLGLADLGGLYNVMGFTQACRHYQVTPVYGADLPCRAGRVILLARQEKGYQALCQIITRFQLDELPVEMAAEGLGDDLVALLDMESIQARDSFRFAFLRVPPFSRRREEGMPLVAAPDIWCVDPEGMQIKALLTAVATGGTLPGSFFRETKGYTDGWMPSAEELARRYELVPSALANAGAIARECGFHLDIREHRMPCPALPPGETADGRLHRLAMAGAARLYPQGLPAVLERLSRELAVIEKRQLSGYFLVMADIADYCRRAGILAVGRGSAAGALVSYCLGITRVCPLHYDLYFERFLNESRQDLPDIDLDICGYGRDQVLDYVYQTYGPDQAAMLASTIRMQARQSFREAAKVFALGAKETEELLRQVPWRLSAEELPLRAGKVRIGKGSMDASPYREIGMAAEQLLGRPRHLGIHPCGMVVSAEALPLRVPLQRAPKGINITQFDMEHIESTGLVKLDLLGQRGLTVARLTLHGAGVAAADITDAFWQIKPADSSTMEQIARGQTLGVFQLESPSMRGMLQRMAPRTVEEVALALAVIRPGAGDSGSREKFIDYFQRRGAVKDENHLDRLLAESCGTIVYQEQVMQIAQEIGGLGLAEADLLRRLMTRRRHDSSALDQVGEEFLCKAEKRGVPLEEAQRAWEMMARFAGYGFCKAHAVSYADVGCRMAQLKRRYPALYLAAVCTAGAGFYGSEAYLGEAQRLGIALLPPDVCYAESSSYKAEGDGQLRLPLARIFGLGEVVAEKIVEERRRRSFSDLGDFILRIRPCRSQLEALAKANALRTLGGNPPTALAKGMAFLGVRQNQPQEQLFVGEEDNAYLMADYSPREQAESELRFLGMTLSAHPIAVFSTAWEQLSAWRNLPKGAEVECAGRMIAWRRIKTRSGGSMLFLTLDDPMGVFEVTVTEPALSRYGNARYSSTGLVKVRGRKESGGQLQGKYLAPLV